MKFGTTSIALSIEKVSCVARRSASDTAVTWSLCTMPKRVVSA
jgi:hypothetical protein